MMNLDTTVYKNGRVARNSITGEYYSRPLGSFSVPRHQATHLLPSEMAVVRASFENVEEERVATLVDEVAAACNRTGRVGYYFNVVNQSLSRADFILSIKPLVCVKAFQFSSGRTLLRRFVGGKQTSFRLVLSVDEVPPVLLEWKK